MLSGSWLVTVMLDTVVFRSARSYYNKNAQITIQSECMCPLANMCLYAYLRPAIAISLY